MLRTCLILICFLMAGMLRAQSQNTTPRLTNSVQSANAVMTPVVSTSVRIESGKVWVNGNLIPDAELPPSLRSAAQRLRYNASLTGSSEMQFTLDGVEYLVRGGKIVALNPPAQQPDPNTSRESYYNYMKQEEPQMFYNLNREAELYEKCVRLVLDYRLAEGKTKDKVREEIRLVVGELFDLNISNMENEVKNLQTELDLARQNIEYRKFHKSAIIEKRLKELLGD